MSTAAPHYPPSSAATASPAGQAASRSAVSAAGSVPQPPDPQLVAEMKQEIRVLVQEVAELASSDIAPEDFYAGFLTRVVSAMAAVGGALWIKGESGKLKLAYQVNLAQTDAERTPQDRKRHGLMLKSVFAGAQAILVPPGAAGGSENEAGNPTDLLLVLSPLIVEKEAEAVVEVFQRSGGGPSTQRGYLRFLVQMCDVACDYLKSRKLRQLADSQSLWRELEQVVQELHRSLDLQQTAYAVVNEGRRMIGCDRVSLALAYGSKCRVEAVSGLDSIDRRATEVQRLAKLATAVLQTREPLWSEAGQADLPAQIEQPLQAYVDQSHARLVAVLPLVPPQSEQLGGRSMQGQPIGALIVEQLRDARAGETLRTRSALVAQHSAAALSNAIEHNSVFLLPLWKQLGKATWLVRGRTLPKTLLVLALVIGGITALAVVPTEFEVAARGKLQPAQRREVFAPLDGVVASVPVRHGQIVESGAVLAELSSTDIELELASLIGRQTTIQERLAALQRAMLDTRSGSGRLTPSEENRLGGEMLELRQEAENIERELTLVRQKQQQLTIIARERGQVVTWKVEDVLLYRPVQRGQGLLALANPDGPWELELYLPERRLKHVQVGATNVGAPDVTFTLASHLGQTFHGRVVEIEQAAEVRGEEGNTVLVRVAVERSELPPLHDQTTVTAKLHCGRTSLGYAWFCDLIETVQSKVLFWLPS